MRPKIRLAATVALSALTGLAVLPSGAGQHFGLIGGQIMTIGSTGAARAAPLGGFSGVSATGYFVYGVDARRSQPSGEVGLFTMSACVSIQTMMGMDRGCVRNMRIPPELPADPLLMQAQVHAQMPSEMFPGESIQVQLIFQGQGNPMPNVRLDYDQNPNDPDVRIRAILARNAIVNGFVVSSDPRVGGGPIAPTPGSIGIGGCVSFAPPLQDTDAFATCP